MPRPVLRLASLILALLPSVEVAASPFILQQPTTTPTAPKPYGHYARRRATTCSARHHAIPAAFINPSTVASTVASVATRSPFATAFVIASFKGAAADWLAQSSEDKAEECPLVKPQFWRRSRNHDFRRSLAFFLYGGLYQGITLEFLYNDVFNRIFGNSVLPKLAFNQLVLTPLVTLPVAYLVKGIVFGNSLTSALEEYKSDVINKGLLTSFWKLWTPVNFLLFSVVPPHLRISFSAVVSFVWTVILSRISNGCHDQVSSELADVNNGTAEAVAA